MLGIRACRKNILGTNPTLDATPPSCHRPLEQALTQQKYDFINLTIAYINCINLVVMFHFAANRFCRIVLDLPQGKSGAHTPSGKKSPLENLILRFKNIINILIV